MAFLRKAGNILGRTVSNHITREAASSRLSILQAIRCMSSSKLFIGGLSYSTDDTSLREAFNKYGDAAEARVIVDRETGRSRGFGFVTYSSVEEASAAIQALDQQELHGRRVRVDYANDKTRGYGGGDFRGGNFGGGGGGYGGGYGSGDNNDGYGWNYGGGGYGGGGGGGGGSNFNPGVNSYGSGTGPEGSGNYASNNGYGGDSQGFGVAGGAGGSDGFFSSGYDGLGGQQKTNEAGANEGYGQDQSLDVDDDDTRDNYADRSS